MKKAVASPTWQELRDRAIDYNSSANYLVDGRHFQNAVEDSFLSVELITKAAIKKAGGKYKKSHKLADLGSIKVDGTPYIRRQLKQSHFIYKLYYDVASEWDMHERYSKWNLSPLEYVEMVENFDKVYSWIKSRLVD